MAPLSRPPSRDLTQSRRLSREETYHLAETARRKSSDRIVRDDLRLSLSHGHLLDQLLQEIARSERELQTSPTEEKFLLPQERKSTREEQRTTVVERELVDEYGFPLDSDDGEEELSLTRTQSRRPAR
ncbi:hypothetical protein H2200_004735 [Cladophialophora chaetospira]|uniref:Uncharacterized protein n=1 Tax=Cladophialophora chaetospira TaxID=386627 RepID=A0AA39CKS7_9EURO|nr:hypothetical protein H2200_004735 [Cladophialophora chaetospira]